MAVIVFLIAASLLLCVRGLWAARRLRRPARRSRAVGAAGRTRPGAAAQDGAEDVPWAEEWEVLLVAALLSKALDRHEYQAAMARLARADEARRPLQVPPAGN